MASGLAQGTMWGMRACSTQHCGFPMSLLALRLTQAADLNHCLRVTPLGMLCVKNLLCPSLGVKPPARGISRPSHHLYIAMMPQRMIMPTGVQSQTLGPSSPQKQLLLEALKVACV